MFIYDIDDVIFILFCLLCGASLCIIYATYLIIRIYDYIQSKRKGDKHVR